MSFIDGLLNILFPPRCVFCRRVLKGSGDGLCPECEKSVSGSQGPILKTGNYFTGCVSPLLYDGDVRESILRFKFKEAKGYAKVYGRILARCIEENLKGQYDLISWVPLSKGRLKKRGYDQAMLLAMAAALELEDVAVETLLKHTDVPAQSGIGGEDERRANISGAYTAPDTEIIRDKRILLIDDIVTTGSTLSECAKVLLQAGASEVMCVTLASTGARTAEILQSHTH